MKVKSINLKNFRSFEDSGVIELGQVNVLIGANNSGKSSIIRGLHQLQHGLPDLYGDVRVGSEFATVEIELDGVPSYAKWRSLSATGILKIRATISSQDRRSGIINHELVQGGGTIFSGDLFHPATEPENFIVPYLSKRKVANYEEDTKKLAKLLHMHLE